MFTRRKTKSGWSLAASGHDGRMYLAGYLTRSNKGWSLRLFPPNGAIPDLRRAFPGITHFANISEHPTIGKAIEHAEFYRALWPVARWEDARLSDVSVSKEGQR